LLRCMSPFMALLRPPAMSAFPPLFRVERTFSGKPKSTRMTQLGHKPVGAQDVRIEAKHDYSAIEVEAIEDGLYEYNRSAVGAHDGRTLGYVLRDSAGGIVGAAFGYSWAGISELKQLWVDERYRRRGYGRALLTAFLDEAASRGTKRVWLSTYDFSLLEFTSKRVSFVWRN